MQNAGIWAAGVFFVMLCVFVIASYLDASNKKPRNTKNRFNQLRQMRSAGDASQERPSIGVTTLK